MIFSPLFVIEVLADIILNCFLHESRVDCRKRFFAIRVVRIWNSLPDDVVSAGSLSLSVRRLGCVGLGGFLVLVGRP